MEKDEALEKTVRVYTGGHTEPQEYVCKIVVFTYDKDAVIDERIELQLTVKCEEPEPAS